MRWLALMLVAVVLSSLGTSLAAQSGLSHYVSGFAVLGLFAAHWSGRMRERRSTPEEPQR